MSAYIEITEAQTEAGAAIDEDLMRGTAGADPDGGIRGDLRNLDARATVLEGGGGGGGGAAGVQVEERFEELRKKFGQAIVDRTSECVCESFFTEPRRLNYRLMRDITASDTIAYLAPNPQTIEGDDSTNLDFIFTGFTWASLAGTDASSVAADAVDFLLGTESVSWSKAGGTAVLSIIERDIGTAKAHSLAARKTFVCFARISTTTQLTDFLLRLSASATVGTNYAEWRVQAQQFGSFIDSATGIGWNILVFDIEQTPDATGGTGFDPDTEIARAFGFGTIVSSSGQTHDVNLDVLWEIPDSGGGIAETHPEFDQLMQNGDTMVFVDNSSKELKVIDVAGATGNPSVLGKIDVSAGFTNGFTGGSSTTVRVSTAKTDGGRLEFESDDSELTSGDNENEQEFIHKTVLPALATDKNFDFSTDRHTPLTFTVKAKPTSTTFTCNDPIDFTAELKSGDKLRIANTNWNQGRSHYADVQTVTLTADATISTGVITFTVSSGDNATVTVGDLAYKILEVDTAISIKALSANDDLTTFLTPDEFIVEDVGIVIRPDKVVGHWHIGGITENEALKNRAGSLPALTKVGTPNLAAPFETSAVGQLMGKVVGPTATSYLEITEANGADVLDPDSTKGNIVSVLFHFRPETDTGNQFMVTKGSNSGGWRVRKQTDGSGNTLVLENAGGIVITGSIPADGADHSCAIVMEDGGVWALYMDGVLEGSTAATAVAPDGSPFRIFTDNSANATNDISVSGVIALVGYRITASDVIAHHNGGIQTGFGNTVGGIKERFNLTGETGQKIVRRTRIKRRVNTHETQTNKLVGVKIS